MPTFVPAASEVISFQSNQSMMRFCSDRSSHTNQAKQVLLGAVEPVQRCRCIIGKRRDLIQTRAGGCARKKGSRAVLSRKFVRNSRGR